MTQSSLLPFLPSVLRAAGLIALTIILNSCGQSDRYPTADGTEFSFAEQRGKWVYINYWAPWCAPCRTEIPELNALATDYARQATVIGVHLDGTRGEALNRDIGEMGIQFTVLAEDPGPAMDLRWPQAVPITWVISPEGEPLLYLAGPQTLDTLLEAAGLDAQD